MIESVAVLSDIHGVLPVLEAILAEPDVAAAEKIVITGDHVAGPQPVEVLEPCWAISAGRSGSSSAATPTCRTSGWSIGGR